MMPERKLQIWARTVLQHYAAEPRYVEQVFEEEDHFGSGPQVTGSVLSDDTQMWLPEEWVGGSLHYAGLVFPIASNTRDTLTVTGDLEASFDPNADYQIIPPDVVRLSQYLTQRAFDVEISYSRLPTKVPAITIRLESDVQQQAFIGESLRETFDDSLGEVSSFFETDMTATYLLTITTQNPQETVWLYQLLVNAYLQSQQQFATWGLIGVSLRGSDLHPDVQFLPEQVYSRYLQFTCTRSMEALQLSLVERVTATQTVPTPHYAELDSKGDPPQ
jgi:hypothetical protein